MKAVIMAGGEGTRLRPLTMSQPKPMLPVANRPMIEHIVELLRRHGFDEIVVTVAFLANTIRTYFGDGSDFGVRIVYATEETPLGTAGSVRNARDDLDERFLVISGDVLTDIDLGALVAFHERAGRGRHPRAQVDGEPARVRDRDHRREGAHRALPREADLGPGLLRHDQHRHLRARAGGLRLHRRGAPVDFSGEVFPALLEAGRPLYGWVTDGYWEDVGTLEAYLRAHADVLDGKVAVDLEGLPGAPRRRGRRGCRDRPERGDRGAGAHRRQLPGRPGRPDRRLQRARRQRAGERRGRPRADASCTTTATSGTGAYVRGAVIGRSCELRRGCHLDEGVVLGDSSRTSGSSA